MSDDDNRDMSEGMSSNADTYKLSSVFSNSFDIRRDVFTGTSTDGFDLTVVMMLGPTAFDLDFVSMAVSSCGGAKRSQVNFFITDGLLTIFARVRELTGFGWIRTAFLLSVVNAFVELFSDGIIFFKVSSDSVAMRALVKFPNADRLFLSFFGLNSAFLFLFKNLRHN